jgi:2-(3-amino-3-carboxypropyl)histidine synthase
LLFSTLIADIIQKFCKSTDKDDMECLILGDVTYGACCVDDLASKALECDFIVHYGHSCLVPIQDLTIKNALYVFVEIQIDIDHLVETVAFNFKPSDSLYLMGTIQFNKTIYIAKSMLEKEPYNFTNLKIP